MSGRNMRDFVVSHRSQLQDTEEQHHLVTRAMLGLDSNRYHKMDYEEAKEAALRFKANSNQAAARLEQLKKRAKLGRERNLIRHHYPIWKEAYTDLQTNHSEAENVCAQALVEASKRIRNFGCVEFADDMDQCVLESRNDVVKFEDAATRPVRQLSDDIKERLYKANSGNMEKNRTMREDLLRDREDILQEVASVKSQCLSVKKWLFHQQVVLESDLAKTELLKNISPTVASIPALESAIPVDVVFAECPDIDLKNMILRQFVDLHTNYEKQLEEEYARIRVSTNPETDHDFWTFCTVYDLYHRHAPSRIRNDIHSLIVDMLNRLLTQATKHEILEMESRFIKLQYSKKHREVLVASYRRDFENLTSSALASFAEAQASYEEASNEAQSRAKQRKICDALHEKLMHLKEKREEILMLEVSLNEQSRQRQLEEEEKKTWLENERRHKLKADISRYRSSKAVKQRQEQMAQERRLAILKMEMDNQRKIDQQRVQYRFDLLKRRADEFAEKQKAKEEEEKMREQRLDNLRQTVAVVAESDPQRLVSDTVSTKARLGIGTNDEFTLQAPLFSLYGYSQREIEGDIRLRVEAALRNAGIHDTDYARNVMSKIKPPTQPRRDNDSSSLQYMFIND